MPMDVVLLLIFVNVLEITKALLVPIARRILAMVFPLRIRAVFVRATDFV